jgi:hypothetical protein
MTRLQELLRTQEWDAVVVHLSSGEGKRDIREAINDDGDLIFHDRDFYLAPPRIVEAVCQAHPEGLLESSPRGSIPIFCALEVDPDPDIIEIILRLQPASAKMEEDNLEGYMPLHYIYDKDQIIISNRARLARLLVTAYPNAAIRRDEENIFFPLDYAVRNTRANFADFKVLIEVLNMFEVDYCPDICVMCQAHALQEDIVIKIQMMIDTWPEHFDQYGGEYGPIHYLMDGLVGADTDNAATATALMQIPCKKQAFERAFLLLAQHYQVCAPWYEVGLPFTRLTEVCTPSRELWDMVLDMDPGVLTFVGAGRVAPIENVMSRICCDDNLWKQELFDKNTLIYYALKTTYASLAFNMLYSGKKLILPKDTPALHQLCLCGPLALSLDFMFKGFHQLLSRGPVNVLENDRDGDSILHAFCSAPVIEKDTIDRELYFAGIPQCATPLEVFLTCLPKGTAAQLASRPNSRGDLPLHTMLKNIESVCGVERASDERRRKCGDGYEKLVMQERKVSCYDVFLLASFHLQGVSTPAPSEGLYPFMMASHDNIACLSVVFELLRMFVVERGGLLQFL